MMNEFTTYDLMTCLVPIIRYYPDTHKRPKCFLVADEIADLSTESGGKHQADAQNGLFWSEIFETSGRSADAVQIQFPLVAISDLGSTTDANEFVTTRYDLIVIDQPQDRKGERLYGEAGKPKALVDSECLAIAQTILKELRQWQFWRNNNTGEVTKMNKSWLRLYLGQSIHTSIADLSVAISPITEVAKFGATSDGAIGVRVSFTVKSKVPCLSSYEYPETMPTEITDGQTKCTTC